MDGIFDRKEEKTLVHKYLDNSPSGSRFFLIHGESGCGKTTLLRYVVESYSDNVISFAEETKIYRCRPDSNQFDYELLSSIIQKASLEHPENFAEAFQLCGKIPTVPALWKFIYGSTRSVPLIKHITATADSAAAQAVKVENSLRVLATPQYVQDIVSELLDNYFIKKSEDKDYIIFAIDDIPWIDNYSLKVLLTCIKRLTEKGICVYTFTTIQNNSENNNETKYITDLIEDYIFGQTEMLLLKNLSESEIAEVFEEANKSLPIDAYRYLHKATSGNFEELSKILRKSKRAIKALYNNSRSINNQVEGHGEENKSLYVDSVEKILFEHPLYPIIYIILYESGNICSVNSLKRLSICVYKEFTGKDISSIKFNSELKKLENKGEICCYENIVVCHFKRLRAATEKIQTMGIYSKLIRATVKTLTKDLNWIENIAFALKLLTKIDPSSSLKLYNEYAEKNREITSNKSVCRAIAQAVIKLEDREIISNKDSIELIAITLCYFGIFDLTSNIGDRLIRAGLKSENFEFQYCVFKAKREFGSFSDPNQCNIFFNSMLSSVSSIKEEVFARTIYCAALEHQYRYDEIKEQYKILKSIRPTNKKSKESLLAQAYIVKNMGLSEFHGNLIEKYIKTYNIIGKSIYKDDREFIVNRAALINHAGLGYFHTGKIKQASRCFAKSHQLLKKVSLYLETPINNFACAQIMLNKNKSALSLLEKADSMIDKPKYQTYSIKMNKSIALWLLGEEEIATNILKKILRDNSVPDPIIHVTANVDLAYIYINMGKFEEASRLLRDALKYNHRFLNDEYTQTQSALQKYALIKAGYLTSQDLGDLSFLDLQENKMNPSFRPYRLDLNSLYVD